MEKQTATTIAKNSMQLRKMHFERCRKEQEMVKVKLGKEVTTPLRCVDTNKKSQCRKFHSTDK